MVKLKLKKSINENPTEHLFEMAVHLKNYKTRVNGLRFQLVENWCLCRYCQLYNKDSQNFNHWLNELAACIKNLKLLDIKNGIDKRKTLIKMLVDDYDYNKVNMIVRIIEDKFNIEKINDVSQITQVSKDFADNIIGIIDVISIDKLSLNSYLKTTFLE